MSRFEGNEVGKVDFGTRLICIDKEIVGARNTYITQGNILCKDQIILILGFAFGGVFLKIYKNSKKLSNIHYTIHDPEKIEVV